MATSVTIGHGSAFAIGDGGGPEVFTDLAEVTGITPPNISRDTVDATHMASTEKWREFVPGLRDPGEVSITLNWIPSGAAQDALMTKFASDTASNFRITYPNAEADIFSAFCVGFAPEDPLDGKMTATVRFKLTGKPTGFLS